MAMCLRTLKTSSSSLALLTRCAASSKQQPNLTFLFPDESVGLIRKGDVNDDIIALHGKKAANMKWAEDDLHRDVIVRQNYHPVIVVIRDSSPLTPFQKTIILASDPSSSPPSSSSSSTSFSRIPQDKLDQAFNSLSLWLPQIFTRVQDYTIYDDDILFLNNIRGETTRGLTAYVRQMSLLRLIGHLRFAYVNMDILKITKHPEDGTVRVRWRIVGVSALRVMLKVLQVKEWRKMLDKETSWYDGFSTFYVGADGKIFKHICDKMMPDEEKEAANRTVGLAAKLALLLGVIPRPTLEDLNSIISLFSKLQDPSSAQDSHHHVD